jgi:hypothetical protein
LVWFGLVWFGLVWFGLVFFVFFWRLLALAGVGWRWLALVSVGWRWLALVALLCDSFRPCYNPLRANGRELTTRVAAACGCGSAIFAGLEDPSQGFNLLEEQDLFHEVITGCIQLLVRALETQCEAGLTKMCKTDWKLVEEVGDTSPYVSEIGKSIGHFVPFVRSSLAGSRKYFTNFCMKFANSFIPRVIGFIYKCKHVSTVAAEQLLLDMQSMRTVLLGLHSFGTASARKAPASFTRFVTKSMLKAEMVLKTVMSPHEQLDPNIYAETYLQLCGEDDGLAGFQKILDMKGLKKAEVAPLLEAYRSLAGEVGSAPRPNHHYHHYHH